MFCDSQRSPCVVLSQDPPCLCLPRLVQMTRRTSWPAASLLLLSLLGLACGQQVLRRAQQTVSVPVAASTYESETPEDFARNREYYHRLTNDPWLSARLSTLSIMNPLLQGLSSNWIVCQWYEPA
jgi:hypothetical protein